MDATLTFNSSWPDHNDRLQGRLTIGVPCALLWMTSPIYAYFLLRSRHNKPLPKSKLFKCKTLASTLLATLSMCEGAWHAMAGPRSDDMLVPAPVLFHTLLLLTTMLSISLTRLEQRTGVGWSPVQCLFWLSLSTTHALSLHSHQSMAPSAMSAVPLSARLLVVSCLTLMHCFSQQRHLAPPPPGVRAPCPDPKASWWSKLTFSWISPLLAKGSAGKLGESDIFLLLPSDTSESVAQRFAPNWDTEVAKSKLRNTKDNRKEDSIVTRWEALDRQLLGQRTSRHPRQRTHSEGMTRPHTSFLANQNDIHRQKTHSEGMTRPHTSSLANQNDILRQRTHSEGMTRPHISSLANQNNIHPKADGSRSLLAGETQGLRKRTSFARSRSVVHPKIWDVIPRDVQATEGLRKRKPGFLRSQSDTYPRTEWIDLFEKKTDAQTMERKLSIESSHAKSKYSRALLKPEVDIVGDKDGRRRNKTGDVSANESTEAPSRPQQDVCTPSLRMACVRTFWADFLACQSLRLLVTGLRLVDPLVFGFFLEFMEDKAAPSWRGYLICGVMVLSKVAQTFGNHRCHYWNKSLAIRVKITVINSLFCKTLTMDPESRAASTVGQAMNLMTSDSNDICEAFANVATEVWVLPVQVVTAVVLLYGLLGPPTLLIVGLLLLMLPVDALVPRRLTGVHRDSMQLKDKRLKMLTEIINGIKLLKMYAWEESFLNKMNAARDEELKLSFQSTVWETVLSCYHNVTPYVVSVVVLVTCVYSSPDNHLSPSTAFVAISLIDILKPALSSLPRTFTHIIKTKVSFRRVNDFLCRTDLEGLDNDDVDPDVAVSISNGWFSWTSKAAPTLKNINLRVKKGSLVAVVGTVGCGKSSLLSACLGEMKKVRGSVSVKGSVAYVPQQAWIQHATLKSNVMFGLEADEALYARCLDNCSLAADLHTLSAGDATEIGEKGINLSGGQKQRVSLARAVFSQSDVYLLDDPLSAVDCHVGSDIFDKVIGPQGMLAGKTRVLVTHGLQWLPRVDQIVVVRHGVVSEVGSYEELLSHERPFAKFLKTYLRRTSHSDPDPTVERLKGEIRHRLDSVTKETKDGDDTGDEDSEERDDQDRSGAAGDNSDSALLLQDGHQSIARAETLATDSDSEQSDGDSASPEDDAVDKTAREKSGRLVQDEDCNAQHASLSTYRDFAWSFGYGWVALLLVLLALQQGVERGTEVSLGQWTDDAELRNRTTLPADSPRRAHLNRYYLALYAGLGLVNALSSLVYELLLMVREVAFARVLHSDMLSRVMRAPMAFFETTPVGRIVSRFSLDLHAMAHTVPGLLNDGTLRALRVAGKLTVICCISPLFLILALPIFLVVYYVQNVYVPTMRQLENLNSKTRAPVFSFYNETLGGTAVIRAYKAQGRFVAEFQRRLDISYSVRFLLSNCDKWLNVRMESMGTLVVGVVTSSAVFYKDSISAGMVALAVTMALDLTGAVRRTIQIACFLQTDIMSVSRVREYCTMPVEDDWRKADTAPRASWPEHGEVKVTDLSLRYREGLDLALKGVTVHIGAGEKVGIVGRTGAGKSSLTLALFRLVEPAGGEVKVDDVSSSDLGLHDLRSRLTILPQDPVIFAGSVRMNLDPFARYTDEELWEALRHAHLEEFVSGLKDRLDHECGEGGDNFSVGQRQLLCLARTLLQRARVLVLDEATAAVDVQTDAVIQRSLRQHFQHCTVISVAHRLHTVIHCDKIIVLDKGQVVEFDTPTNLIGDPQSVFHGMVKKAGLLNQKS